MCFLMSCDIGYNTLNQWQFNIYDKSISILAIHDNFTLIYIFIATNFNVSYKQNVSNITHNILWKLDLLELLLHHQ